MRKVVKRVVLAGAVAGVGWAGWRALRTPVPADHSSTLEWERAPFPFPPVPRPPTTGEPTGETTGATAPAAPPPRTHVPPEIEPGGGPETEALGEAHVPPSVEPNPDGTCPATHPVKGKLASGIFHVATGVSYARTKPDRCYVDAQAAEADGLRPAKH